MQKSGTDIQDILVDAVANRAPGEVFAIATIEDDTTYLSDYTDDYASLKLIIGGVTGEDKDAYIIEYLYKAIESFNNMDDCGYKRIILISDGVDAMEIGYSRSELDDLIKKTPYPIYTIGVKNSNEEELQDMFSLSRSTGVGYFYLEEIEEPLEVVQELSGDYSMSQIKVTIPEEMRDGSVKNTQLSIVSGTDTISVQTEVTLPFLVKGEDSANETGDAAVDTSVSENNVSGNGTEVVEGEEGKTIVLFGKELPLMLVIGIAGGVVLLIVAVIAVIIVSKKKKQEQENPDNSYQILDQKLKNERNSTNADGVAPRPATPNVQVPRPADNPMLNGGSIQQQATPFTGKSSGTQMLFDGPVAPAMSASVVQHRVVLTNVKDSVMTYQCGVKDKIIIGRNPVGCNIAITTDNAVSERHCEISVSGGKFYVKDLGSSNGTMVDSVKISAPTEVKTGCVLKLGREEYRLIVE